MEVGRGEARFWIGALDQQYVMGMRVCWEVWVDHI